MSGFSRRAVFPILCAILALGALSGAAAAGQRGISRPSRPESPFQRLVGVWEQVARGSVIALKEIYIDEHGMARMRYVQLAPGVVGGDYSVLDMYDDGDVFTYEDYGDKISRHILTLTSPDEISGEQELFPGPASLPRYVMRRVR